MKKLALLFFAVVIMIPAFSQTPVKSSINPYQKLDQVLSPFEDMTEYALDGNIAAVNKAMIHIERLQKEGIFNSNLTNSSIFNQKSEELRKLVSKKDLQKVALISASLFKNNMSHFKYASSLKRQLQIEHLDYMGYQVLALLKQDKTDWKAVEDAVNIGHENWLALSSKVKDYNMKDSFNQLFKGLKLSIKQKNNNMMAILGYMDLSLVDVLESSFK